MRCASAAKNFPNFNARLCFSFLAPSSRRVRTLCATFCCAGECATKFVFFFYSYNIIFLAPPSIRYAKGSSAVVYPYGKGGDLSNGSGVWFSLGFHTRIRSAAVYWFDVVNVSQTSSSPSSHSTSVLRCGGCGRRCWSADRWSSVREDDHLLGARCSAAKNDSGNRTQSRSDHTARARSSSDLRSGYSDTRVVRVVGGDRRRSRRRRRCCERSVRRPAQPNAVPPIRGLSVR